MKRVLLTGASGFIGRQCLPILLQNGFEVHGLSLEPVEGLDKDVIWHCHNFLDDENTRKIIKDIKPSHCLHLAWYTEPGKYWTSTENLPWTASSISLLKSFYQNGGERFVGAGTCAEYDWRYGYCSESITPLEPSTLYGICKNSFQKILTSSTKEMSISSAWGRVFFLYGPCENPARLVPSVILSLLRGEPALCSDGNQLRDYMYINDVANSFVHLLLSEVTGPVNIASGKPVLIKEIISKIAELLNGQDNIKLGALPAKDEPAVITANVTRLINEVGFTPKFELESGLKQTIDWWRRSLLENK